MPKEHLCKICNEKDPLKFYKGTTKSTCKACLSRKTKGNVDSPNPDQSVTMDHIRELRDQIQSLDEYEIFELADGRKSFREMLTEKIYSDRREMFNLKTDIVSLMDALDEEKSKNKILEEQVASLVSWATDVSPHIQKMIEKQATSDEKSWRDKKRYL